jgi:hypothetical protein
MIMMNLLDKIQKHIFTNVFSPLNMRGVYDNTPRSIRKQTEGIPRIVDVALDEVVRHNINTYEYISPDFSKNRS